eukprot:gene22874-biopygen8280
MTAPTCSSLLPARIPPLKLQLPTVSGEAVKLQVPPEISKEVAALVFPVNSVSPPEIVREETLTEARVVCWLAAVRAPAPVTAPNLQSAFPEVVTVELAGMSRDAKVTLT